MLIETLTRAHHRKAFDSGDQEVTSFLREKALHDHERDLSRTMVLLDPENSPKRIVGYHTLLMRQVKQKEIPNDRPRTTRGIAAILLGQIGVDVNFQGKGLGDTLLMDAQARPMKYSRRFLFSVRV